MTDTTAPKTGYAPVNGIQMYYEIHGAGRPLVLIHGGGSTIETTFGKILPLLAKNRQIIAMELQAHGRTSDRDAPESFAQDADDVAALLDFLHIDSADVLGFSNGGQTGMQLAISHPKKVRKLVVASAFYKRDGVPAVFWGYMANAQFSDMPQGLKDDFLKVKNDSAALLNMFHKDAQRMQNFRDWTEGDIRSIKAQTLILIGDRDLTLPEHAVAMSRLIPDARLAIVPGTHGSYLGESTTLVNGQWKEGYMVQLIERFLNED